MMLAKMLFSPTIVHRHEWKAKKPLKKGDKFVKEVTNIVISQSNTPQCHNKEECVKRVQEIQNRDMKETGDDIKPNFLVGGDGNVYEGRGYRTIPVYPEDSKANHKLKGNAFEVCFIGDIGEKPTMKMLKAFAGVVVKGITEKVLVDDVKKMTPCLLLDDEVIELKTVLPDKDTQNKILKQFKEKENSKKKGEKSKIS